jgi:DNA invertase Pin-like site-specific DNA recombinase
MALRDSDVPLAAADMPDANTLTFTVMAGLAQYERELISSRTKDALAISGAARRRAWDDAQSNGYPPPMGLLGGRRERSPDIRQYYAEGVRANRAKAHEAAELMREDIEPLVKRGLSLRKIAARLNEEGQETPRGKHWSAQGVANVIERLNITRPAP